MIKSSSEIASVSKSNQLVNNKRQELVNIVQLVNNIDPKMISICKRMGESLPDLIKFVTSVKETIEKSLVVCQKEKISEIKDVKDISRVVMKEIGVQYAEQLKTHSKKISEIGILISDINQLRKDIVSTVEKIEKIKEDAISFKEQNTDTKDAEVFNELITEIANNDAIPFLEKTFELLSGLEKATTQSYDYAIDIIKKIEKSNNKNISIQPINILPKKEIDHPVFVGTLLGGKSIIEGNGKLCIMGTGPGFSWNNGKVIEFDQETGEWTLALEECNEKFEYKFAVVFDSFIYWEDGQNRTWDPKHPNLQEITAFEFPKNFPNRSEKK